MKSRFESLLPSQLPFSCLTALDAEENRFIVKYRMRG